MSGPAEPDSASTSSTGQSLGRRLEAAGARAAERLSAALPLDAASGGAGRIAALLGPILPFDKRARRNLDHVWPQAGPGSRREWRRGVYDNFARSIVEYPHLARIAADPDRLTIEGAEHLLAAKAAGRGAILATAHFGQWEAVRLAARRLGWETGLIYRRFNNPLVDAQALRLARTGGEPVVTRGASGLLRFVRHLKRGGAMAILADHRMDGIRAPFLGREASSSTAAAEIALSTGAALIPARGERLGGARFRAVFEPPILPPPILPQEGGATPQEAAEAMTLALNARYEAWIQSAPGQWFWLHRRWGRL
ncbi:lysophospholipid acyltransferase family protein [Neomegalonema sp.]|uniref:lysophospholipid acyltransferase family protein n=1 Tax=Neomegalonema sp. TaxID=2039713 RepID=UPI00262E9DEA|nr:lysophospholipid acyltransferase family protein [Neomegalonema sp.]MDD2868230.1 lysophospholipid acyltransferase family protein [Neomegalonema sp.]